MSNPEGLNLYTNEKAEQEAEQIQRIVSEQEVSYDEAHSRLGNDGREIEDLEITPMVKNTEGSPVTKKIRRKIEKVEGKRPDKTSRIYQTNFKISEFSGVVTFLPPLFKHHPSLEMYRSSKDIGYRGFLSTEQDLKKIGEKAASTVIKIAKNPDVEEICIAQDQLSISIKKYCVPWFDEIETEVLKILKSRFYK